MRPELDDCWDYRIFVAVDFATTLLRALQRDRALFGSAAATRQRYLTRYSPGQAFYLCFVRPQERADAVVENDDPQHPRLIVRRNASAGDE